MIKQFNKNDANELSVIMQIWYESNCDAHPFIDESYWKNHFETVKEAIQNADVYVIMEDNQIKGFIGLINDYIAGLFVQKNARHHGLGKQLLNNAKQTHQILTLEVYEKNQNAVQFYEKNGFKIIETKLDPDTQEMEHLMKWE